MCRGKEREEEIINWPNVFLCLYTIWKTVESSRLYVLFLINLFLMNYLCLSLYLLVFYEVGYSIVFFTTQIFSSENLRLVDDLKWQKFATPLQSPQFFLTPRRAFLMGTVLVAWSRMHNTQHLHISYLIYYSGGRFWLKTPLATVLCREKKGLDPFSYIPFVQTGLWTAGNVWFIPNYLYVYYIFYLKSFRNWRKLIKIGITECGWKLSARVKI